jgi:RNA polymerase sigma-70 factor, ECF subfamily
VDALWTFKRARSSRWNMCRSSASNEAARLTYSETPDDDNDDELVRRARLGDADRFTTLVRRHQARVYRLAWRMVGPEAAEDVAQQAFVKAWLGLDQFAGASSFGTWLYRLAMNCCLDHLRRAHRFRPRPLDDADASLASDVDVAEVVIEALEQAERAHALAWALERLPSDDRLLLHLRLGERLPYERIAELLGVKSSTVGTRLFRARARLHRLIARRMEAGARDLR